MSAAQIAEQQHNTQNLPTPHTHRNVTFTNYVIFPSREIRSVLSGIQQLRERPSVGVRVRPEGLIGWPEYRWWPVILNTGHADSREHTLSPAGSDELMMRERTRTQGSLIRSFCCYICLKVHYTNAFKKPYRRI